MSESEFVYLPHSPNLFLILLYVVPFLYVSFPHFALKCLNIPKSKHKIIVMLRYAARPRPSSKTCWNGKILTLSFSSSSLANISFSPRWSASIFVLSNFRTTSSCFAFSRRTSSWRFWILLKCWNKRIARVNHEFCKLLSKLFWATATTHRRQNSWWFTLVQAYYGSQTLGTELYFPHQHINQ